LGLGPRLVVTSEQNPGAFLDFTTQMWMYKFMFSLTKSQGF